jgi:hypothetical protein
VKLPCRRGDFVDCLFPFAEYPTRPGPMRHIAYVRAVVRLSSGALAADVMFTTTSPRMSAQIPPGLSVRIAEAVSRRMGMRNSFVIDIHRLALLPLEAAWFPDIENTDFVIGRADDHLRDAVAKRYADMVDRDPAQVVRFGPKI